MQHMQTHESPLAKSVRSKWPLANLYNKGSALVVALFIMALVSILAMSILKEEMSNIQRFQIWHSTTTAQFSGQEPLYAAMDILMNNVKQKTSDQLIDTFPLLYQEGRKVFIPGGIL